jgi:hypothetical protein
MVGLHARFQRREQINLVSEYLQDRVKAHEQTIRDMDHVEQDKLLKNIELKPSSLRALELLARRLRDVQANRIMVTEGVLFPSLGSRAQIFAEKMMGSAIHWWPLREPLRTFGNFPVIIWSCVSISSSC